MQYEGESRACFQVFQIGSEQSSHSTRQLNVIG